LVKRGDELERVLENCTFSSRVQRPSVPEVSAEKMICGVGFVDEHVKLAGRQRMLEAVWAALQYVGC